MIMEDYHGKSFYMEDAEFAEKPFSEIGTGRSRRASRTLCESLLKLASIAPEPEVIHR